MPAGLPRGHSAPKAGPGQACPLCPRASRFLLTQDSLGHLGVQEVEGLVPAALPQPRAAPLAGQPLLLLGPTPLLLLVLLVLRVSQNLLDAKDRQAPVRALQEREGSWARPGQASGQGRPGPSVPPRVSPVAFAPEGLLLLHLLFRCGLAQGPLFPGPGLCFPDVHQDFLVLLWQELPHQLEPEAVETGR